MDFKAASSEQLGKILWDFNCIYDDTTDADVIIGLGSHDLRVADQVSELYKNKFAPLVLFSGGLGRLTTELWNKPEAELFAERAIELGVPPEVILLETKSTNTGENILLSKKLLEEKQISISKAILVHKPYMQKRTFTTAKKLWPNIEIQITAQETTFEKYSNDEVSPNDLINLLVGDTQRLIEYPMKEFAIDIEIPDIIKSTMNELIDRGFTQHLIRS